MALHFQQRFRDLPLQQKLVVIIMLTLWLAMSLASLLFVAYDYQSSKLRLEQEVSVLSKVIALRSSAAVAFRDTRAAEQNLQSLSAHNTVQQACLYFNDHSVMARYHRLAGNISCPTIDLLRDAIYYADNTLFVRQNITLNNRPLGSLLLQVSLDDIHQRLRDFSVIALLIMLGSGLTAYLLTSRLQRIITDPVQDLNRLTSRIRDSHDYSLRAQKIGSDEIGNLADSLNSMLHTIQYAHMQLNEAVLELKEKNEISEAKVLTGEEKNKAIQEFFSGVSHDLKQPINAIGLFIEAMKHAPSASAQLELMDKLEQSALNLGQMFNDLLDMSKLEHGLKRAKIRPLQLQDIFHKLGNEFGVLANDKNIKLVIRGAQRQVVSDELMLERIVRNLLSNAIRYTREGGVLLGSRDRGDFVDIEVWDSGRGIPADKLSDIFKPHVQLDNPDHDPSKGFGLGLSIVKKMVDTLGHQLTVRSQPGRGTVMRLRVKKSTTTMTHTTATATPAPLMATAAASSDLRDPLHAMRVLMLDDDENILHATRALLQGWGLHCQITSSLSQALQALDPSSLPHILLTDYSLGHGETGVMFLQQAQQKLGKNLPAIIITGEQEQLIKSLREQGFNVLQKPVLPARLRAMLNHVLK